MTFKEFTIDSKDKNKLSARARNFHYAFGLFLIVTSSIGLYRLARTLTDNISYFSFVLIFVTGVFWIIRGAIGRDFMFIRKYVSISDESILLKKPFLKEIKLSKDSITLISLKPSGMELCTNAGNYAFDLTWLSYMELQLLKKNLTEFAEVNRIELKYP